MKCSECHGTGEGTLADGRCAQCLGTGYFEADADVIRRRERAERRAAKLAQFRATHGKNGTPELQAVR